MWHWDQGRLSYFQFDSIRRIATFIVQHNFKQADRATLIKLTGFDFKPVSYSPWRNYARVVKLCLLVSEQNGKALPTPIAQLLAKDGAITCDEYLHFLAQASTEPSPALAGYAPTASFRYPLLIALKYLLTKTATKISPWATLSELIDVYRSTTLTGAEDQTIFIGAVAKNLNGASLPRSDLVRQARESLLVATSLLSRLMSFFAKRCAAIARHGRSLVRPCILGMCQISKLSQQLSAPLLRFLSTAFL